MASEDSEKGTRIGPKSSISFTLAGSLLLGAIYIGMAEMRIEGLERDRTEVRSDIKEILRRVDEVRVHMASMDRRGGITEERVADHRPR